MGVIAVESVSDRLQNPNFCLINSVAYRTLHLFGRLYGFLESKNKYTLDIKYNNI